MKLYFFVLSIFFNKLSFSQTDNFEIKQTGRKYTHKELVRALQKADWCGYFHFDSRYKLTFDDGSIVELFSKKEIQSDVLNDACFQGVLKEDNAIYKIHESGIIVRLVSARNTSKN